MVVTKFAWRGLGSRALDLLYPPLCPACGAHPTEYGADDARGEGAHSHALCPDCTRELWPCREPCCLVCGEAYLPSEGPAFVCQTCRGRRFAFDYAVAPFQGRGVLRELIHRFKYEGKLHLRTVLGQLFSEVSERSRFQTDLSDASLTAIPVPLHPRKFRERQFNQAHELCLELRRHLGLPCLQALRRTRYTSSQTRYRREQRMTNLRDAFAFKPRYRDRLEGRAVALVDDVFTTGSTANACARVLKEAGAKKVVVLTLARG